MPEIKRETAQEQVDRLSEFILAEVEGEPSESQGAVDTAIRLLREHSHARIMTVERDGWREGGHLEGGCLRDEGLVLLPLRPGTVVAVLSEPEGGNTDTRARHVCTECGRLEREDD